MSKRLGSRYRSGRTSDWLKFKNPEAPAVKREAEEDWGDDQHSEDRSPASREAIASASPTEPASLAASCSCRPNCRPSIATWLKRPCSKLSRTKLGQ